MKQPTNLKEVKQTGIIRWLLNSKILAFGDFTLKSGRKSKYFLNFGDVYDGVNLDAMGNYYCDAIKDAKIEADVVFGPAYKGIPIVVSVTVTSASHPDVKTLAYCFDRKEEKDHGDKGMLVGSPVKGKDVIIVDDVITSGKSVVYAANMVQNAGGCIVGVCVFVDRMEPCKVGDADFGTGRDYITASVGVPVVSVLTIAEIADSEYVKENHPNDYVALRTSLGLKL